MSSNVVFIFEGGEYQIPKSVAEKYKVKKSYKPSEGAVLADDFYQSMDDEYTKPAILLRGVRHREGLSQVEFAIEIGVTQADLSKMENGKRPIGKIVAKRIQEKFGMHYSRFLG